MSRSPRSSTHIHRTRCTDAGQATPLVAVALVLAVVVVLALIAGGSVALDAARARTAADAAALAGAAEGPRAARDLAEANGGRLLDLSVTGEEVEVEVAVGRATARARARREGTWCRPEAIAGAAISYTSRPCPSSPG